MFFVDDIHLSRNGSDAILYGSSVSDFGIIEWCLFFPLTHWGLDKIDAISQTTFSNVLSAMKMFEFWFKFHWS